MKNLILIGLGGFAGSVLRYLLNVAVNRYIPVVFPWGTFSINILGSLLLGILISISSTHKLLNDEMRLMATVGFCGGFTTFSTFAYEGFIFLEQKQYILMIIYILASVMVGLAAVAAGYYLTNKII